MVLSPQKSLLRAGCVLIAMGVANAALAQGGWSCASSVPPSIGLAFGRSSPYLEGLDRQIVGLPASGSFHVDGGRALVGRVEVPVAGPLRLRIEGGTARWDVRHVTYGPPPSSAATDTSAGHLSVRHLAAFLGLRMGRPPVCAHVSAGAGLYSLGFGRASTLRSGAALAMGVDMPTGDRGAIQIDGELHLIGTGGSGFITSSTVPALQLLVGWSYRF